MSSSTPNPSPAPVRGSSEVALYDPAYAELVSLVRSMDKNRTLRLRHWVGFLSAVAGSGFLGTFVGKSGTASSEQVALLRETMVTKEQVKDIVERSVADTVNNLTARVIVPLGNSLQMMEKRYDAEIKHLTDRNNDLRLAFESVLASLPSRLDKLTERIDRFIDGARKP